MVKHAKGTKATTVIAKKSKGIKKEAKKVVSKAKVIKGKGELGDVIDKKYIKVAPEVEKALL